MIKNVKGPALSRKLVLINFIRSLKVILYLYVFLLPENGVMKRKMGSYYITKMY